MIGLESSSEELNVTTVDTSADKLEGEVFLPHRGIFNWKYLKISSEAPFGLYQVWIYFPLSETSFAYPALLKDFILPTAYPLALEGERTSELKGPDGIHSLAPYQGEESRRISWKHFAKSGDLWVKEGQALHQEVLNLVLAPELDHASKERTLSELATTMMLCHQTQTPFTFLGKYSYGPGYHQQLLKECLRELAIC